ncbi:hypothetical protein BDGGKGIB_02731 [Nodularia sphaerocarpa UHCC 0038]|nr:hypothetical protein BDGGKGIB_02731 [Nodularia sphaerocarpa UHCC 0038]
MGKARGQGRMHWACITIFLSDPSLYSPVSKPFIWVGCVMDVSPNAPRIEDGALRYATTHPTNSLFPPAPCTLLPASFPTPHSLIRWIIIFISVNIRTRNANCCEFRRFYFDRFLAKLFVFFKSFADHFRLSRI